VADTVKVSPTTHFTGLVPCATSGATSSTANRPVLGARVGDGRGGESGAAGTTTSTVVGAAGAERFRGAAERAGAACVVVGSGAADDVRRRGGIALSLST
jgi:hypothetical protein